MKNIFFSVLFLLISNAIYCQDSYIQIKADPGIIVYLDDVKKGVTKSDLGGLYIEEVSAGSHLLKFEIEGYNPQEVKINIRPGQVFEYSVQPFTPKFKVTQSGNKNVEKIERSTGNLSIQSLPISLQIKISKLGLNSNKDKDKWLAEKLPIGEYEITFIGNSKSITKTISIEKDLESRLFVNMLKGTVEVKGSYDSKSKPVYYPSGKIRAEKLNLKNYQGYSDVQVRRLYHENGQLEEESITKGRIKVGNWRGWHYEGNLKFEKFYENNKKVGEWKSYARDSGEIIGITNYISDQRHGYYFSSRLDYKTDKYHKKEEGSFLFGKKDGVWKFYGYDYDAIRLIGKYNWKNGKRHGLSTSYSRGKINEQYLYNNGKKIKRIQ